MDKSLEFANFVDDMLDRMDLGEEEYGDRSFSNDPLILANEIQEELLDVANWAFIMHNRIENLAVAIRQQRRL
jgi:hypothetical protein